MKKFFKHDRRAVFSMLMSVLVMYTSISMNIFYAFAAENDAAPGGSIASESSIPAETTIIPAIKASLLLAPAVYDISTNVDPTDSAAVILSKTTAAAGEKVTFVIENHSKFSVSGVFTEPAADLSMSDEGMYSFEMPDGDVVIHVELSNDIAVGDLIISADEPLAAGTDYSYSDGCLTILTDRNISVKNADPQVPSTDHIYIPANVAAHLTLCGINIRTSAYNTPAINIAGDSDQTVRISLAGGTGNLLYAAQDSAIRKPGSTGRLVIDGNGSLDARSDVDFCPAIGGKGTASAAANVGGIEINGGHIYIGTMTARDASSLAYTGIGGGYNASASDIFINGGEITFDGFMNPVGGGYDPYGNYAGSENIVFSKAASIKAASFKDAVPAAADGSSEALVLCSELPLTDGLELSIDGTSIPGATHDDGVTGMEQKRYIYLTPASADNPHEIAIGGRNAIHIYYEDGEWLPAEGNFQEPIRFDVNAVVIALQDYSAVPYEGTTLYNHNNDAAVQYTSSNRSIAAVDGEGKVSLFASGSVVITAVSKKSGCPDVSASYTITIKEKHDISLLASDHGAFSLDQTFAMEGEEIAISSVPEEGYVFAGYSLYNDAHQLVGEGTGSSFVMRDELIRVSCAFRKPSVQIIVRQDPSGHGLVSAPSNAFPGEDVYVTSVPEKGYTLVSFDVVTEDDTLIVSSVSSGYFSIDESVSGKTVYIIPRFAEKIYSVSIAGALHGNAAAKDAFGEDIHSAAMGETVRLQVTADPDYELSSLSVKDPKGNDVSLTDMSSYYEFAMPASDVSITPAFTRISHDIRIEVASLDGVSGFGGHLAALNEFSDRISSAVKGETVTLRAYPDTDYVLSYLNAIPDVTLSKTDDIMYSFEMPDEEILIKAAFAKTSEDGTREAPWRIGADGNPGGITAYIGGDRTLFVQTGGGVEMMRDFNTDADPAPYISSIHSIKEIVVSEGVSNIGDYAFYDPYSTSQLTEVSLPDSLRMIGKYAFSGFSSLEKLTIPANVDQIDANCFAGDTNLHTVVFEGKPDDFAGIDDAAFAGITADVIVPSSWLAADGTFDPSAYQFGGKLTYIVEGTATEHVVNVRQPEHGTIELPGNLYQSGDPVTVTLKNSADGFGWYPDRFFITPYVPYSDAPIDGGRQISFTMPDCDVEISAAYASPGDETQPWLIGYEDASAGKYKDFIYAWCSTDPVDSSKKILTIEPQQENAVMVNFESGSRPWDIYADEISMVVVKETAGSYLNNIGERAFKNLTSLKEADLGSQTQTVGKAAFAGCAALEKVRMSGVHSVNEEAFANCGALVSVDAYKIFSIGRRAFYGCTSFLGNTEQNGTILLDLDYTSTLYKEAFSGCASLKTVQSSDLCGLAMIPEKAFSGCSALTEVTLAKSVNKIEAEAFADCASLAKFYLFGDCNDIASSAFLNDALKIRVTYDFLAARNDIDRQPHINDPGGKWYYGAKQLTYIVSPTATADNNCAVKINQTESGVVKLYRQGCLKGSTNWIEIVSGGSLWQGEIAEIKVGGNVVSANAIRLNELTYIKDVPGCERTRLFEFVMPMNAGDGNADVEFKISFAENAADDDFLGTEPDIAGPGKTTQPWYIAADGTSRVQARIVDGTLYIEHKAPSGYPIAMMDFYGSSAPWYSVKSEIKKVVIDEGITSIGSCAFLNCKNLESAVLPSTIAKIGADAFYASGIKRLDIPAGVKEIGREAFYGCTDLSEINYEGCPSGIHSQAFRNSELTCYVTDKWLSGGVTLDDLNDKSGKYQYDGTISYVCASGAEHAITLNPSEGGTVTLPFDKAAKDTLVVFDVTPDYGYSYERMISAGVSVPHAAQRFVMPANDVMLTPVFSKNHYYIYSDGGEGVFLFTEKAACDVGDTVAILAEPDPGYAVTKYVVCENRGDRSVEVASDGTFTMPAFDVRISAESVKIKYNVTVNRTDDGLVFVNGSKGIPGEVISACVDDVLSLSATPVPGRKFREWQIEALGEAITTRENTYTMPACDITVTAVFDTPYPVTIVKAAGGKVTCNVSDAFAGDPVQLAVFPDPGYKFAGWEEKPSALEIAEDGSFVMPEGSVNLKAGFEKIENMHAISSAADGRGTLTIASEAEYNENVTFIASPFAGYRLRKVSVKKTSGESVMVCGDSFLMPDGDVTVTAEFEKIPHTVKLIVSGGSYGTASLLNPDIAGIGDIVKFSVEANADCRIDQMVVSPWADISDNGDHTYSFEMPPIETDVIVGFAPIEGTETYPWQIGRETPENVTASAGYTAEAGVTGLYIQGNGTEEMMNFSDGGAPWAERFGSKIGDVKFVDVVNISDYALAGNYQLSAVEICEGVRSIGKGAFKGCEIEESDKIVFEGKPDRIEPDAFEGVEATVVVGRSWLNGGLTVDDLNRADGPYQYGGRLTYEVRSGGIEVRLNVASNGGETHGSVTLQAERTKDPNVYRADKGERVFASYTADEGYTPFVYAEVHYLTGDGDEPTMNDDWPFTLPTGDYDYIELMVEFKPMEYYATYDFCGRSNIQQKTWAYNETIGLADDIPVIEGYEIEGWYTDPDFTKKWNYASDTMPARDMTLYAKWEPKKYTITWNNHDGSLLKTTSAAYGEIPSYDGDLPTKGGASEGKYVFDGWDPIPGKVTGEASYTATFEAHDEAAKTVIFDMNGHGDPAAAPYVQMIEEDLHVTEPSEPSDPDYSFGGWYRDRACSENQQWRFSVDTVSSDVTILYAKWTISTYTVIWTDADGTELLRRTAVPKGSYAAYTGDTPAKASTAETDYEFSGWDPSPALVSGDTVYTAKYSETPRRHIVSFDNGGKGKTPAAQSVQFGEKITDPGSLKETGYVFDGWYSDASCTSDSRWSFDTDPMPAKAFTLYAKWTPVTFTITWLDADRSVLRVTSADYNTTPVYDGAEPYHAPDGPYEYEFAGWTPGLKRADRDETYQAVYLESGRQYTVTFDTNGKGTGGLSLKAVPGSRIAKPDDPSAEEYDFAGWFRDAPCSAGKEFRFDSETMPQANLTLYAKWTLKRFKIVWKNDNGNVLQTDEGKPYGTMPKYIGETPTKPETDTETFVFDGWTPDIRLLTADIVYTAKFRAEAKPTPPDDPDPTPPDDPDPTPPDDPDPTPPDDPDPTPPDDPDPTPPDDPDPTPPDDPDPTPPDDPDPTPSYDPDPVAPTPAEEKNDAANCAKDGNCPIAKFADLDTARWYHNGIHYCLDHGIMSGKTETEFAPNDIITRGEIAAMLWRLEGRPVVDYFMQFKDVAAGKYYSEAIRWTAAEKIAEGYSAESFGVSDAITREQLAVILYRYAQKKGEGFTDDWMFLLPFDDRMKIGSYAEEAVHWCYRKGIIAGKNGNVFDPQGRATRAEAACMIQRFCERNKAK